MPGKVLIYTDGGSRGNPGPAAAGFVLTDEKSNLIAGRGIYLGNNTNNFAEHSGLIKALEAAKDMGVKDVAVFSDSQLMVRQINGDYKVKSPKLKGPYSEVMDLLSGFSRWCVSHIYRERNEVADGLVNQALDKKRDVSISGENRAVNSREDNHKKIRLGVLISGGGRTLLNLQEKIESGSLSAEVAVVICSRSTISGVQRARKAGLEVRVIRKKDFSDIDGFSERIFQELESANVDLVVQAGWLCLWKIPSAYVNRVMNIHPALLPSFGGKGMWGHHVHEAVLESGMKVSGCTVHFCTNEYDNGPIVVQRCCQVRSDDDADSLAARVFEQECIAYPEAIELFAQGRLVVQDGRVYVK